MVFLKFVKFFYDQAGEKYFRRPAGISTHRVINVFAIKVKCILRGKYVDIRGGRLHRG